MHAGGATSLGRSRAQLNKEKQAESIKGTVLITQKKKNHTNPTAQVSLFSNYLL